MLNGVTYTLISSKLEERKNSFMYGYGAYNEFKTRHVVLSYIATTGRPGMEPWMLQTELEKVC